jgi:single-stranded-DNA-specific exonuclease
MLWEKTETQPDEVRDLARRYGLDLITASVLVRRGLTASPSLAFLLDHDLSRLPSPFLFKDMGRAVDRILRAVSAGELIHVFGDSDVDGITATVVLVQALLERGARVNWRLPEGEEDYGLSGQAVERAAAEGCTLLLTVDCGISNQEEIAEAARRGIETIVLDHHNPPDVLPPALAIVNPKLRESGYPFRDLSGCGVAAKLVLALDLARTPLYNRPVWLLNVLPANAALNLEAVRMVNLAPAERIRDSIPEGEAGFRHSRLAQALAGQPALVLERESASRLLARVSPEPPFPLEDLQSLVQETFPELAGLSLLRIRESFAPARIGAGDELDSLAALYTRMMWRKHGLVESLERVLDLTALGTIADLMPLVGENRVLVRRGLEVMGRFGRPGLRELLIRQNLHGRRLTAKDLSWQVTPVLNSAGRMGQPGTAARIFLSEDSSQIEGLIEEVLALNDQRKAQGDRAWELCSRLGFSSMEKSAGKLVYVADGSIPRGITGLIASRLVAFFKVPALVVARGAERSVGSLRSPYPLDGFLDRFADLLVNYGGHDCAAGFSMQSEELERFESRLYLIARDFQPPTPGEPRILIDAEVPPGYLNPELIKVVEFFEPFGEGSPPLTFLTRRVRIESLEIIGRREAAHVKLLLAADRYRWPAVFWNAAGRAGKDFGREDLVDIVYRLGRNYFMNTETLQLTLVDLKR